MNNELNMLLKAKVVKLKVELDYKGSALPAQVDGISEKLKNKPVKLKVKLDLTVKDLNQQLNALHTKMNTSKTAKTPIKLAVQLDVKGSATAIQKQLKEVYKTVEEFNKKYGKQIAQMQAKTNQAGNIVAKGSVGGASVGNMIDVDSYMNSLKDAERYMKSTFGKGLFTSQEMKNANGELLGFTTSLTKANGVVQKIRYEWDANQSMFTPISQQTLTETEKSVSRALNSLRSLDREIATLGKSQDKYWKESQSLYNDSGTGKLTQEAVDSLRRRIKDEQALESGIKRENTLIREQRELLAQINREQKKIKNTKSSGELGDLKGKLGGVDLNDSMAKNQISDIKSSFKAIKDNYDDQISKEKDLVNATKKRADMLAEIERLEKSQVLSSGKGAMSHKYVEDTKKLAKTIETMEHYVIVRKRMDATNRESKSIKIDKDIATQLDKLKTAMFSYATATGRSQEAIEDRFAGVSHAVRNNLELATSEVKKYERMLNKFNATQSLDQKRDSVVGEADHKVVSELVTSKDSDALKRYVSELNNANVAMMKLSTNDKGVTRITAQFESTKKTAREVVYEIDKVDKKLRQVGEAQVFNANRNLGVMEQLKIAMARVPVWMVAMTAFYGTINSIRAMTDEILRLDKAMTELRRVADAQINIAHVFEGAIDLSKELGNNIHDVMASVNDLARTFGHFNERQLLAIAKTSTLMSNVSDLTAQEATENLIGTMNAFNITAEDSIRIVDALNEVDNNYAISTKQLATGLAKSASTSKTFGVTLEENVGHITAIGAVTMESGNIIGNSLKTIYSRITTMAGAEEALNDVGVAISDMATGEVRDVSDILGDLAGKWDTLSDSERQNIAVKVAGRYQLSRFLALMNNYEMATEATATALTSEGSAIRENAEYMKSYEARINQLKNGFTELSSAMGDAFLSSGLSATINTLTKLAEVAVTVVDKFGALPVVFGLVSVALLKFGVFGKLTASIVSGLTAMQASFTATSARATVFGTTMARSTAVAGAGFAGLRAGAVATATTVKASFNGMLMAVKTFSTGFKVALASTGIGIAFVALGFVLEKIVSAMEDSRVKQEELQKLNDKMVISYRASSDGMQSMISRYTELSEKTKTTTKEQEELNLLTKQFAEQLPTTVEYVDANGEAHLKTSDAIKQEIKAVAELSKQQAILKEMNFEENMKKESKSYLEIIKNVDKLTAKKEKLIEQNGKEEVSVWTADRGGLSKEPKIKDNTKAIQENAIEIMMAESQKTEAIQGTIKAVQEQALSYFEANGKLEGLGESQMKVIEDFISYNENMLRSAKNQGEVTKAYETLYEIGKNVGTVFSDSFEIMTAGLEGQPDLIAEIRDELGMVSESIPKDFFKIDPTDSVNSMKQIENGLKEIINVSTHIEAGSTDFSGLQARLETAGLSSDQAGQFVSKLAREHDNLLLRQEAYKQGFDGVTESVDAQTEALLNSVDVISSVFGYEGADLSSMKSHIELLEVLQQTHGDSAKSSQQYKDSLGQLSDFLNVTDSEVEGNIHQYNMLIEALQKLQVKTDAQGGSYLDLSKETSGLSQAQLDLINTWIDAGGKTDILTGANIEVAESYDKVGDAYNEAVQKSKEPFKAVEVPETKGIIDNLYGMIGAQKDAKQAVVDSMTIASKTVKDVADAGNSLGKVKEDIDGVGASADDTKGKTIDVGTTLSSTFTETSKVVNNKTQSMITKQNGYRTAIDNVATSARLAKQDLINMNNIASNSMDTLSRYESKVSSANNATANSPIGNMSVSSYNGVSESVANSISSYSDSLSSVFSATAGEGGESTGGGGEGTSGVIQAPTFNPFVALHGTSGSKTFSTSSSSSSSAKKSIKKTKTGSKASSTKDKAEALAELYVVDMLERNKTVYEGTLRQIESRMNALAKGTTEYREAIRSTLVYENKLFELSNKSLATTIARNKEVNKRLKQLGNTSKHNKDQRDEYNKLQQEYDSNLTKIAGLKSEIENTINSIKDKSMEVFSDFIDGIINKYSKSIDAIDKVVSNLDFKLSVLELTDPNNVQEEINLNIKKATQLTKERAWENRKVLDLEREYNAEMKKNPNSDKAKYVKEQLDEAKDAYNELTLEILRTEKNVADIRGEVADDAINQLKEYYRNMKEMATEAIDAEIESLKKAHDEKVKMYDDEIGKINDIYDAKRKSIDKEEEKLSYEEELSSKNAERDAIQAKIDTLSFGANSGSLEDKKKVSELQKQLEEQNKEIDKYIREHNNELLKEQLDEQQKQQIEAIEGKKESEQKALDAILDRLEKEKEAVSNHYDSIIDNEKYWSDMRNEFIKGNFKTLETELGKMEIGLDKMSRGIFDGLTESFKGFSDEVKKQVAEMNELKIANSIFNSSGSISDVGQVSDADPFNPTGGASKPKPPAEKQNKGRLTTGVFKDKKSADEIKSFISKTYSALAGRVTETSDGWKVSADFANVETAEKVLARLKELKKIGTGYISSFDTGGLTGDWQGNDGKLGILHKKEIVLKENDTTNLLDTIKLLNKTQALKHNTINSGIGNTLDEVKSVTNISYGNVYITIDGKDKRKEDIAKELMIELKKRGR